MVTNLHEGMSTKCAQYWPQLEGETEEYGDCEVMFWLVSPYNYEGSEFGSSSVGANIGHWCR